MKKKLLVVLLSLTLCVCSSALVFASAQPVTGSEPDRSKIGQFYPEWNSGAWSAVITEAFVGEYERLESLGFNPGTVMDKVSHWEIGFKQEFNNGDGTYEAWGHPGRSMIFFYNALADAAFSLYNDPYEAWMTGTNKDILLMPTSNQRLIGEVVYQNFSGGYTKGKEVVRDKNVVDIDTAASVLERNLSKAEKYAQTYSGDIWNNLNGRQLKDIARDFSESVTALENTGFDIGTANKEGVKAWATAQDSGTLLVMDIADSDSNTSIWGDPRDAMAVYNANTGKAHILYDEIAKKYIEFKLTTPKSDLFVIDGVKYQNFTNGYIKVTEGVAETVMNKNFDKESKTEIGAFDMLDIGRFDVGVTAKAEIKAAVTAKIQEIATEKELSAPVSFVTAKGENIFAQSFEDSVIYIKVSMETVEEAEVITASSIYIDGRIYSAFNSKYGFSVPEDELGAGPSIRLGNPRGEAFTVAGKTYMNFDRGCIVDDGTEAVVKTGYKATLEGVIENLVFSNVAFLGANFTKPSNVTITDEELIAKFNAKYASLMAQGLNIGAPDDGGISLWAKADYAAGAPLNSGDGWVKQGFVGGNGEGFTFGVNSYLVYNITKNEVYLIRDYVLNQVQYILFNKGAPTADTIVTENTMKQQFEGGYINATKNWGVFVFYDGKNIGDPLEEDDEGGDEDDTPPIDKGCAGINIVSGSASGGGAIMVLLGLGVVLTLSSRKSKTPEQEIKK